MTRPWKERFSERYTKTKSCWIWNGYINNRGYGSIFISGRTTLAHRAWYEENVGKIPAGLQLDHLCRNRRCVNPGHLEVVSSRENTLRGVGPSAINSRKTHCNSGHLLHGSNLITKRDGSRSCRACRKCDEGNAERCRIYYEKRKASRYWVERDRKNREKRNVSVC